MAVARKLHRTKNTCGCDADVTAVTAVMTMRYKRDRIVRDQQVHHYRRRDGARFWHWARHTTHNGELARV